MKTFQDFVKESSDKRTSMDEFEKLDHKFLPFVFKELKIKTIPPLHFRNGKDGLHVKDIPGVLESVAHVFATEGVSGRAGHDL